MILTFRPLTDLGVFRPRRGGRKPSPFQAPYSKTLALLQSELRHLGAKEAFVQVALEDPSGGVRIDGQIRAGAKVTHPGVVLTIITRNHGTLVYPCDAFSGSSGAPGWQANLRAIALGLEALRKVERYGIADRGQQYAGFRELGGGTPMPSGQMSIDEAAAFLGVTPDADPDEVASAYRSLVKEHHPDAGGDPEVFRRLTDARDLLS